MKTRLEKQYRQLCNSYKKTLNFGDLDIKNIDFFMDYLKFLRDGFLLTEPLQIDGKDNEKIIMLQKLLLTYNSYKIDKELLDSLIADNSDVEIINGAKLQTAASWKTIWGIVAMYGESWFA